MGESADEFNLFSEFLSELETNNDGVRHFARFTSLFYNTLIESGVNPEAAAYLGGAFVTAVIDGNADSGAPSGGDR